MYYSFCYVSVEQNCIHKYIMLYISLQRRLHLWDNCLSLSTLSSLYSLFHCSGPSSPASALRTWHKPFPGLCSSHTVVILPSPSTCVISALAALARPRLIPSFWGTGCVGSLHGECLSPGGTRPEPCCSPCPLRASCGLRSTKEGCGQWAR